MATIFTQRLFALVVTVADTPYQLHTGEVGKVTIVRDLVVSNTSGAGVHLDLYVPVGVNNVRFFTGDIAADTTLHFDMRQQLLANESLTAIASAANQIHILCTAYVFTG